MHRAARIVSAAIAALLTLGAPFAAGQATSPTFEPQVGQAGKDVIWLPTPDAVVTAMLRMARVTQDDYVVDLGSGDGKIPIAAARDYGARAHGIEFNGELVALSRRRAQAEGVGGRATFERADIFAADFSAATVVTLYLLPSINLKLRPTLLGMRPGTRIVSHAFDMGQWKPDQTFSSTAAQAYLWIVPADASGRWRIDLPGLGPSTVSFEQTFQELSGKAVTRDGRTLSVENAQLRGAWLEFEIVEARGRRWRVAGAIEGPRFDGSARQGSGAAHAVAMSKQAAGVVATP